MTRWLPLSIWLLAAVPLTAQPLLLPGTRVRVLATADTVLPRGTAVATGWRVGTLISSTREELVLQPAGAAPQLYPMSEIRQIDVSRGRPNHRWRGATVGGLLSGAAFVGLACAFSDGSCSIGDNAGGFLVYYAVGAIPGAIVGGALGARHRGPERWSSVWDGGRAVTP